jgi:hypothetical protein
MKVWRRWGAVALLSLTVWSGAFAAPATNSVEMLREMFRAPVTEWQSTLRAHRGLLNEEFFVNAGALGYREQSRGRRLPFRHGG